jgi:hypothetical protein
MENTKEVLFSLWCSSCKHKDTNETDDPCNECLAQGWNIDSTKPIFYAKDE